MCMFEVVMLAMIGHMVVLYIKIRTSRNADGSRILEFTDWLNQVICNTLFMKQESQLVTYAAGSVKSTVDCIIVLQEDRAKVIPNKVCVPKHKLLVMDM